MQASLTAAINPDWLCYLALGSKSADKPILSPGAQAFNLLLSTAPSDKMLRECDSICAWENV